MNVINIKDLEFCYPHGKHILKASHFCTIQKLNIVFIFF